MSKCYKCGQEISIDRLEGLQILGKPEKLWDCLDCAPNQKVRGIYHGYSGIAPLVIVSDVGTDKTLWREDSKENEVVEDFSYHMEEE